MIELTEQQRHEVGENDEFVRVIDPATRREFVLVPAEIYSRLRTVLGDFDCRDAYPAIDRAFASGWDDPKMSDYDVGAWLDEVRDFQQRIVADRGFLPDSTLDIAADRVRDE